MNNKQGGCGKPKNNYMENRKKLMSIRDKEIRKLYKKYSMAEVAVMTGVSKTTVFFVLRGR